MRRWWRPIEAEIRFDSGEISAFGGTAAEMGDFVEIGGWVPWH